MSCVTRSFDDMYPPGPPARVLLFFSAQSALLGAQGVRPHSLSFSKYRSSKFASFGCLSKQSLFGLVVTEA